MKIRVLCCAATFAYTATSALAADLAAVKSSVPALSPSTIWTGFYAGVNAGATWANNNNVQYSNYPSYIIPTSTSAPFNAAVASVAGNVSIPTNSSPEFIGGGQLGYNYQFVDKAIVGFETDIQGVVGSSGNTSNVYQIFNYSYVSGRSGALVPATLNNSYSASKSLDYLGTARGKIGYLLTPQLSLYATGGLAYGGVSINTFSWQNLSRPAYSDEIGPGNSSYSQTRVGWTVGGGLEWMASSSWSIKAEYLYYDLGSVQANAGNLVRIWNGSEQAAGINTGDVKMIFNYQAKTGISGNIARLGVNYHFNSAEAPIVAKY